MGDGGQDLRAVAHDATLERDEDSMRQRRAQATQLSSASPAWSAGSLKTVRKPSLRR